MGLYFKDHQRGEILSEWEEVQLDYDETWWHSRKALRFDWDGIPRSGTVKAHHSWGHHGFGSKNAKRKTLRTHRVSRKKARSFRLRTDDLTEIVDETPVERRRKKRLGGREHRCGREWLQDQRTGNFRIVYKYGVPDFDE